MEFGATLNNLAILAKQRGDLRRAEELYLESLGRHDTAEGHQRLRLDAELVTLSACETALGRELAGEGVLGLTRAFHHAGARTVVSSLWKVSDRSSALLMERFYRHLLAGHGEAEALRRAQLDLLRGTGDEPARLHPFYWAAFQVHGAWD